jgi:hypothetical protein
MVCEAKVVDVFPGRREYISLAPEFWVAIGKVVKVIRVLVIFVILVITVVNTID